MLRFMNFLKKSMKSDFVAMVKFSFAAHQREKRVFSQDRPLAHPCGASGLPILGRHDPERRPSSPSDGQPCLRFGSVGSGFVQQFGVVHLFGKLLKITLALFGGGSRGRVRVRVRGILLISALLFLATANAETPEQSLQKLLAATNNYSANFTQSTREGAQGVPRVASGRIYLEKPNRFRWETASPNPQIIVSDGVYLWAYDPGLMQVTQQKVTRRL